MICPIKIGIIGDFDPARPSHKATNETILHCARALNMEVALQWLPTPSLEGDVESMLARLDGLWCSPGSPYKSMQGR